MLGLIILFHEFGHFIVAKKNGVTVVEFAVGMGPLIWSKVKNGTRYALRAIPMGGACMMLGDDNGIPDPEISATKNIEGSFQAKSVWVRIAVIFAGPFFNFVLAFILSVILLGIAGIDKPTLAYIKEGSAAESAGLMVGDQITKLNNTTIRTARDITMFMSEYTPGTELSFSVLRDGQRLTYLVAPEWSDEDGQYMLGIGWNAYDRTRIGVLETLGYGLNEVWYWIKLTFKSIGMLFTGDASVNDLAGPVGVVDLVDETVESSKQDGPLYIFLNLANLCVLLSANVGVMNLLPIPALDGGRLLFLIIEVFRGKPIDKTKEGYVHVAGFLLLLLLMIFVLFNDVRRML